MLERKQYSRHLLVSSVRYLVCKSLFSTYTITLRGEGNVKKGGLGYVGPAFLIFTVGHNQSTIRTPILYF